MLKNELKSNAASEVPTDSPVSHIETIRRYFKLQNLKQQFLSKLRDYPNELIQTKTTSLSNERNFH